MSAQPTDDALEAAVVATIREHEATEADDDYAQAVENGRQAWHWGGYDEEVGA